MTDRLPVLFVPHGGGPWPFVDLGLPASDVQSLGDYLRGLAPFVERARAILVISAHWEGEVPTVMTHASPPMVYDYYGFPPESYTLQWPAPGSPELAARVREALTQAGIASAEDDERGFDHGTFVPMMLAAPEARVPTLQLSLQRDLDPAAHLALGRALAPLRDEGVLIVASGMSYHNLRAMRDPRAAAWSKTFDAWLVDAISGRPAEREAALIRWADAPAARLAHPREEHLLPLMVAAGAAGTDPAEVPWQDTYMGWHLSAVHFG